MGRRSNLECKLAKLWQDCGTIYIDWYSELGMMLDEPNIDKIIKLLKDLKKKKRIFMITKERSIIIDYIGF